MVSWCFPNAHTQPLKAGMHTPQIGQDVLSPIPGFLLSQDQLDAIIKVMGTPSEDTWPGVSKLPLCACPAGPPAFTPAMHSSGRVPPPVARRPRLAQHLHAAASVFAWIVRPHKGVQGLCLGR
jgi:hypothetical protein